MPPNPEFVIVPGAWHLSTPPLPSSKKRGYTVHGVNLRSVGPPPHIKDFAPDVEAIKAVLDPLLSAEKDVVMVYHSYGGVPGSEALKGYLPRKDTIGGKVKRLVYVAAFVLPEGAALMDGLQGEPLPWFDIDGDSVLPINPKEIFYNDMSLAAAEPYIKALQPQAYHTFASALTVAPWKVIPSTYVLCAEDKAIPLQGQEGMVAAAKEAAPDAFDIVERCGAGHSPFISQPEWLAGMLIKAAGGAC